MKRYVQIVAFNGSIEMATGNAPQTGSQVRLAGSLIAAGLFLVAGLLVLTAPIFGVGLASAPWAAILGGLLALDLLRSSGRIRRIALGVTMAIGSTLAGSFTYTVTLILVARDDVLRSPVGIAMFVTVSALSLAIFYAPIGLGVGIFWAALLTRWGWRAKE